MIHQIFRLRRFCLSPCGPLKEIWGKPGGKPGKTGKTGDSPRVPHHISERLQPPINQLLLIQPRITREPENLIPFS